MKKGFAFKKGFTFIELLISISIIAIVAGGAFLSPGVAGGAVVVNQGSSEIKNAIRELQNYAVGQDRSRVKHYVLIIRTGNTSAPYCNQGTNGTSNQLEKNQYMICSTKSKDANVDLDTDYQRVRAANVSSDLEISGSSGLVRNGIIVINARTFDGQLGVNQKYYDTGGMTDEQAGEQTGEQTIEFSKDGYVKVIKINPIVNIVNF